jgi:hypothetical protein
MNTHRLHPACRAMAFVAVLLALAASTSACGDSGPKDPFTGTWDGGVRVVVAKPSAGYRVSQFDMTWEHAERDGDVLHCWQGDTPKPGFEQYLTYQEDSGRLLLTQPAPGPGVQVLLQKVSDSTVTPVASASATESVVAP